MRSPIEPLESRSLLTATLDDGVLTVAGTDAAVVDASDAATNVERLVRITLPPRPTGELATSGGVSRDVLARELA